jgi:hypothetical protein
MINELDIMNQPINTGDCVVFGMGGSMTLLKGIVKKINKKTVTIQRTEVFRSCDGKLRHFEKEYQRAFDNVVVIK